MFSNNNMILKTGIIVIPLLPLYIEVPHKLHIELRDLHFHIHLNPETLVINSELLKLFPDAVSKIKSNLKTSISNYKELFISNLGTNACVMGACALAIKYFLEIPELSLTFEKNIVE